MLVLLYEFGCSLRPAARSFRVRPHSGLDAMARTTRSGNKEGRNRYFIEAVGKAIDVVAAFHGRPEGMTVDQVASLTGIPKSSAYRLLCTLVESRVLQQSPDNTYSLGPRLFELASSAQPNLKKLAEPVMRSLWAKVRETINLGVLDGNEVLFLSRIVSPHPFRLDVAEGTRFSVHATALGKAMTAFLPEEKTRLILRHTRFERFTPHTIPSAKAFLEELARIRRAGYSIDDEEAVEGGRCLAAPISNAEGAVVGALSISGPATRINAARLPELAALLMAACRRISADLGAPPLEEPAAGGAHPAKTIGLELRFRS